jgi:hypothetical protein
MISDFAESPLIGWAGAVWKGTWAGKHCVPRGELTAERQSLPYSALTDCTVQFGRVVT